MTVAAADPATTELSTWELARSAAGEVLDPAGLDGAALTWLTATLPGTVAGSLRALGQWSVDDDVDFDADDWWFRTTFDAAPGPTTLHLGGLATIADVWCNDSLVLHSENMFIAHDVPVDLADTNQIVIVCRSLRRHLAVRRPRPRWKTRLVESQQLRWARTTLLGRMPGWTPGAAPVGPWRPVSVVHGVTTLTETALSAEIRGSIGVITFEGTLRSAPNGPIRLSAVGRTSELTVHSCEGDWRLTGELAVPDPPRWWPHTHGSPTRHQVAVEFDRHDGQPTATVVVGNVGFRALTVDRDSGAFTVFINDERIFCRGACWTPLDVVALQADAAQLRAALTQVVTAGMNMVRVTGTMIYEDAGFYELCDELGVLVWQDLMFANMDYPVADPSFVASVATELDQVMELLRGHPSVVVVCGGSEVEQQAAMMGLDPNSFTNVLGREWLPAAVDAALPGVATVACSPSGGLFPFSVNEGVSHYYGVGAYQRPLDDARHAGVRFTSECLAFANVPGRQTVEHLLRDGERPIHAPRWKARVPRDRGAGWDFDDVRDHYVREIFSVDPSTVRYADPDRYLDLGRAAVHIAISSAMSAWRRPGSTCAGALVLMLRDLWEGAGWGLIDANGRTKSGYDAMTHAAAPLAVLLADEGLDGLSAAVINDGAEPFSGTLRMTVYGNDGGVVEAASSAVVVEPHDAAVVALDGLLDGFRDLSYSYRFGPCRHDVIHVELLDSAESGRACAHFLPKGHNRPVEHELGLRACAHDGPDGLQITVGTERFAQFVNLEIADATPSPNWFHLAPGQQRTIDLVCHGSTRPTYGEVRALNLAGVTSVDFARGLSGRN